MDGKNSKAKLDTYQTHSNTAMFMLLSMLGVIAIWLLVPNAVYAIMAYRFQDGRIPDQVGIAGDFFGSVNALFAGLAFLLILISVRQGQKNLAMQQEELRLQREELIEQRKVLTDQAESQKAMIDTLNQLCIETRLSSMVNGLSTLASTVESGPNQKMRSQLEDFLDQIECNKPIDGIKWDKKRSK